MGTTKARAVRQRRGLRHEMLEGRGGEDVNARTPSL